MWFALAIGGACFLLLAIASPLKPLTASLVFQMAVANALAASNSRAAREFLSTRPIRRRLLLRAAVLPWVLLSLLFPAVALVSAATRTTVARDDLSSLSYPRDTIKPSRPSSFGEHPPRLPGQLLVSPAIRSALVERVLGFGVLQLAWFLSFAAFGITNERRAMEPQTMDESRALPGRGCPDDAHDSPLAQAPLGAAAPLGGRSARRGGRLRPREGVWRSPIDRPNPRRRTRALAVAAEGTCPLRACVMLLARAGRKPGSVPALPPVVVIPLGRPLPDGSCDQLEIESTRATPAGCPAISDRSCSRWGLPCPPRHRGRGALLPHRFTLTGALRRRRSIFCCTVLRVTPTGR